MMCPRCESDNSVRYGYRIGINGKTQRYMCKNCGFLFIDPAESAQRYKFSDDIILYALGLHLKGHSTRRIAAKIFKKFRVQVSSSSVHRYIRQSNIARPALVEQAAIDSRPEILRALYSQLTQLNARKSMLAERRRKLLAGLSAQITDIDRCMQVADSKAFNIRKEIRSLKAMKPRPSQHRAIIQKRTNKKIKKALLRLNGRQVS